MFQKNRKYVGYLCFFIGVALVVYGLSVYLDGPKEDGTSTLECAYEYKYIRNIRQENETSDNFAGFFGCENYFINNYIYTYVNKTTGLVLVRGIKNPTAF
jgi:hypothetical protein